MCEWERLCVYICTRDSYKNHISNSKPNNTCLFRYFMIGSHILLFFFLFFLVLRYTRLLYSYLWIITTTNQTSTLATITTNLLKKEHSKIKLFQEYLYIYIVWSLKISEINFKFFLFFSVLFLSFFLSFFVGVWIIYSHLPGLKRILHWMFRVRSNYASKCNERKSSDAVADSCWHSLVWHSF